MKKILFTVILMTFLPVLVQADEECTQEKLNSYLKYVDQVKITYNELGTSGTYEVYADNVTGGIALDKGRIIFDKGPLGYWSENELLRIKAYVADGGVCKGETIKYIEMEYPKKENNNEKPTNPEPPEIKQPEDNNVKPKVPEAKPTVPKKENEITKPTPPEPENKENVIIDNEDNNENNKTDDDKFIDNQVPDSSSKNGDIDFDKSKSNNINKVIIISAISSILLITLLYIFIKIYKKRKL